jgi:hypothetical protein
LGLRLLVAGYLVACNLVAGSFGRGVFSEKLVDSIFQLFRLLQKLGSPISNLIFRTSIFDFTTSSINAKSRYLVFQKTHVEIIMMKFDDLAVLFFKDCKANATLDLRWLQPVVQWENKQTWKYYKFKVNICQKKKEL